MPNKILSSIIVIIVLLCLTGLAIAGHHAYGKVAVTAKARAYASEGYTCYQQHRYAQAIDAFTKSLALSPRQPIILGLRGMACVMIHRDQQAILDLTQSLPLLPASDRRTSLLLLWGNNNLAWVLATSPDSRIRNGVQAIAYAQRAVALTTVGTIHYANCLDTLAAAEASAGHYAPAAAKQQQAITLLASLHDLTHDQDMRQRLRLYQQGKPYTEAYVPVLN